jgi:transposase
VRDEAQRLRAEGLSVRQIAERLGVARATVGDWVKQRKVCPDCGGEMGGKAHRRGFERCRACCDRMYRERLDRWIAMRREGMTNAEIAAAEGASANTVASLFKRARREDPSVPRDPYMAHRREVRARRAS